ncbi:MAG: sodium:calcium antiporter [Methyloceanibacter sp.]|nr:sodium:calcium antiporter [Methyloceanibacter sp.]
MISVLAQLPLAVTLGVFIVAATGVWLAGTRLALYADAIAARKRIGQAFMGLIFVAAATSLPELVTTLVGAYAGEAQLVLGNMFGGITMQTAILAVVDLLIVTYALTSYPSGPTSALEATLLIVLLAMLLALHSVGEFGLPFGIGLGTLLLGLAYVGIVMMLRHYDGVQSWVPVERVDAALPRRPVEQNGADSGDGYGSTASLVVGFALMATAILLCGLALIASSAAIAEQTGLGSSFIGMTLLATATSLPEVSTTISAVRIGAYSMAISNVFGSNLLMVAMVLPADIVYGGAPILGAIDQGTAFAIISGILVTSVYLAGLIIRSRRTVLRMGVDSALVLLIYAITLAVFYHFSGAT